jgi:hypothetical protein
VKFMESQGAQNYGIAKVSGSLPLSISWIKSSLNWCSLGLWLWRRFSFPFSSWQVWSLFLLWTVFLSLWVEFKARNWLCCIQIRSASINYFSMG